MKDNNDRLSVAFFFTPNYDVLLTWPNCNTCNITNNKNNKNGDKNIVSKMIYSKWRKYHIKKAIQNLK